MKEAGSMQQEWTVWGLESGAFGSPRPRGSRELGQPWGSWQRVMATIGKALETAFPMGALMSREKRGKGLIRWKSLELRPHEGVFWFCKQIYPTSIIFIIITNINWPPQIGKHQGKYCKRIILFLTSHLLGKVFLNSQGIGQES